MSGRLIGASLSGYAKGRRNRQEESDWKEEREYRRERRERRRKEEEFYDPIKRRGATRGEGREVRTEEDEEFEVS